MPYCTHSGRWCLGAILRRRESFRVNGRIAVCSYACAEDWAAARGEIPVAASTVSSAGRTHHDIRTIPKSQHQKNAETHRPPREPDPLPP